MVLIVGGRSPTTVYADTVEHTHIWADKYDDKNHWEYCTVCGAIQNKEPHTLVGNGQSMAHYTTFKGEEYKESCACGYQSKPFIIILGRYENYKDNRLLNYEKVLGTKLDDYMQISKEKYEQNKTELEKIGCIAEGNRLEWIDDNNDGYGWVFCGGLVQKSTDTKGTIEITVGTEGDCGRKNAFDENFALIRYVCSTNNPSRLGFADWLKNLINSSTNPTRHCLYGYDTKYKDRVTDEQFSKLLNECHGYSYHATSYGDPAMYIKLKGFESGGASVYVDSSCYDSSNNHYKSFSDGIKTDCDVCGAHLTGNENYEKETWYQCSADKNIPEGQIRKCSGHKVYGREYMGTVYDTFTKINGVYYRTKVEAVPAAGYTATINCNENQKIHSGSNWNYYGTVRFSNGTTGRTISCGAYDSSVDEDPPAINTITMTPQTSSNGWATISRLDVSGTENYCNTVYLTITNKSNSKVMLDNAAVQVANKKYSYTATPPLEGSESGTIYTASVKDLYGNVSTKDFTVYKTDGTAPQAESKLSYTDWTNTAKTITLTFTDYGSGGVQASLGDQAHYQACTKTADGKYQVTYTFSDNIVGTKNYTVYMKDALGNATGYTLTVGNIDKNTYNISYNLDGGSMSEQPTSYNVESSTFTLPTPTKTGYTFTGWTGSNGTAPQMTVTVNKGTRGNLNYTANWQVNMYTNSICHWITGYKKQEGINFDKTAYLLKTTTFQSHYESAFVLDSAKAINIPNGCCLRMKFGTFDIEGTWNRYSMGTKVTQKAGNMNFEYNYDPISYSITYNLNGGTNSSTNPSTYDVLYGVSLKAPTKAGYTFTGWYDENGNKITGINEGCNAKFSSADDLYAKLAARTTGNRVLTAHWSYNPISVKVPQMLIGDHTGKSQFRVKCDDFKAGNIKISVPNSFLYKQTGKADITATITSKSGNNTITPTNKVCIYDITANGLSAGCWQGSFNIGLTLTKE